jgi:hypothetical protein
MVRMRRTSSQLLQDAVAGLLDALDAVRIDARFQGGDAHGPDGLIIGTFDGRPFELIVEHTSYCTMARAEELIHRFSSFESGHAVPIVVADRVTADARMRLQFEGWSWLDLSAGQLFLRAPGIRILQPIEPARDRALAGPRRATISAGSGVTVAYWLCSHPGESLRPTRDAPKLGIAPSTISTAVGQLAAAGLVDRDGSGVFPELFWELASRWQPQRQWLAAVPPSQQLADRYDARQWRLTGTAAAIAWGAPIAAGPDQVIELYVPGPAVLNTTARRYGVVPAGSGPAVVAVAPTSQIMREPEHARKLRGWSVAPLIAVALDLATDRGRGREILQEWDHANGVWR